MNNSNTKRYRFWLVKVVVVALGSLLPASLTANNDLDRAGSADTHSTTHQTTTLVATDKQTDHIRHTIRFPGKHSESGDLSTQFFNALSLEMTENQLWCWMESDETNLRLDRNTRSEWIYQRILFGGEKISRLTVMREQTMKAFSRAAAVTFNDTPWGREVKSLEEKLSRYFVIAVSKDRFDAAPTLQFPGDPTLTSKKKTAREYAVSLSSSFYADVDSLQGDYALTLNVIYSDYLCEAEYDFGNDKLTVRLENDLFNTFLDGTASLSLVKRKTVPPVGFISLAWSL